MENQVQNSLFLCGEVESSPIFSHETRDIKFFTFTLLTKRLSGTFDKIPVIIREEMISPELYAGTSVKINAELRSYNKKTEAGNRLIVSAFAKEITLAEQGDFENDLELFGTLCKEPVYRKTPLGREICDLMLAINRKYGRSDYLPAIVWGQNARHASELNVGDVLSILGRLQSREYIKVVDGIETVRTTYEVSVSAFEKVM